MAPLSYFHVAEVNLGILSSSGIRLSSICMLLSFPGCSYHSIEWANIDSKSTSPPKYLDKSTKWVACSTIGPQSIDLFHHASFRLASYASSSAPTHSHPSLVVIEKFEGLFDSPMTYRAEVIMTTKLFSSMILFIFCTAAEYLNIYPTLTKFPFLPSNNSATFFTSSTELVDTGFSTNKAEVGNASVMICSALKSLDESIVPRNEGGQPSKTRSGGDEERALVAALTEG